jgi:hypothetical protein
MDHIIVSRWLDGRGEDVTLLDHIVAILRLHEFTEQEVRQICV